MQWHDYLLYYLLFTVLLDPSIASNKYCTVVYCTVCRGSVGCVQYVRMLVNRRIEWTTVYSVFSIDNILVPYCIDRREVVTVNSTVRYRKSNANAPLKNYAVERRTPVFSHFRLAHWARFDLFVRYYLLLYSVLYACNPLHV